MENLQLNFNQPLAEQAFVVQKPNERNISALHDVQPKHNEINESKFDRIADWLKLKEGSRVLELSCCSNQLITYLKERRNVKTLSLAATPNEFKTYQNNGLDAYIRDFRSVTHADFGTFDALLSIDTFGKTCSIDEYNEGKQDKLYQHFFSNTADLLPAGGRMYLQTFVLVEHLNIKLNKSLAISNIPKKVTRSFGTCLPTKSAVLRNANHYYNIVRIATDTSDYLKSISTPRKVFSVFAKNDLQFCLKNGLLDHFTLVLEKK